MARYKVLIVDDGEDVLAIAQAALKNTFDIVVAKDGRDAIEIFLEEKPDVVVTDVYMPSKDGLDLIKEIREKSNVPIIVESGGNIENLKNYFEYHHVIEVIKKPFSPQVLREALDKALADATQLD